jgi:hypothetical protein
VREGLLKEKLLTVKVSDLIVPKRDENGGGGHPHYIPSEARVGFLRDSMRSDGFWDGYLRGRPSKGKIELAFGVHRVKAAKEEKLTEITIVVGDYSDDQMARMQANENMGRAFYWDVMVPVKRVVEGYAKGTVKLLPVDLRTSGGHERVAPSFVRREGSDRLYTAYTVADRLGWLAKDTGKGRPFRAAERVLTAVSAWELIERKVLKEEDFAGFTTKEAKALVDATKARMRSERADLDSTIAVRGTALKKAEKEGDSSKVKALSSAISDLEDKAEAQALRGGKSAAHAVAVELKELKKKEGAIVDAAAPESIPTKAVKSNTQVAYDLTARAEVFGLDTDPKHAKALEATPRAKDALAKAYDMLAARLKNRAKELRK